ncbi:hypothetical protein EYF80_045937 [Liparis tanakae]|uniref:Uncharacterized protein n=1 Tax=Liparis tanakae TaxID=230148 RepID=A0A4Z2FSZ7_9TELE|nr:hypothetical protein EYF80_045937 [Liparis tanakae]
MEQTQSSAEHTNIAHNTEAGENVSSLFPFQEVTTRPREFHRAQSVGSRPPRARPRQLQHRGTVPGTWQ